VLYWVGGLVFWISQTFFHKNLLQAMMGKQIELPDPIWQRLNFIWVAFFVLLGLLNIYVAYSYPTSVWVDFKVFGVTGIMFLFIVAQGVYLMRHVQPTEEPASTKDTP